MAITSSGAMVNATTEQRSSVERLGVARGKNIAELVMARRRLSMFNGSVFFGLAVVPPKVSYLYLTRIHRSSQIFHRTPLGAIPLHVSKARSLPCLKL